MKSIRRKPRNFGLLCVLRDHIDKIFSGLGLTLFIFVLMLGGCSSWEQPGETAAEGRRRHIRAVRVNRQEMAQDLDRAFLLDEPSKLTDKKVP